jgi:hypothetical protein
MLRQAGRRRDSNVTELARGGHPRVGACACGCRSSLLLAYHRLRATRDSRCRRRRRSRRWRARPNWRRRPAPAPAGDACATSRPATGREHRLRRFRGGVETASSLDREVDVMWVTPKATQLARRLSRGDGLEHARLPPSPLPRERQKIRAAVDLAKRREREADRRRRANPKHSRRLPRVA